MLAASQPRPASATQAVMPACPACGAGVPRHLRTVDAAQAAQHFVLREAASGRHEVLRRHIEARWQSTTCDVMECRSCGFGFAWPYVAGDAMFYELAYAEPGYPTRRWEFDRTLAALQRLPVTGKRAIEIGAGFGAFLDIISPRLFMRDDLVAVEYNSASRQVLAASGYRAIGVDIRDADFPADVGSLDYAFIFQALEHMDALDELFARLRAMLTERGHLFIAVPNPRRIEFNEDHSSLLDMPPNHIGRWSIAAFKRISARHGFSVMATDHEPCRLSGLAKQDAVASYLRRAQRPGTVANHVRRWPRSRWRRLAEFAVIAGLIPARLAVWGGAAMNLRELGQSLWVHLGCV